MKWLKPPRVKVLEALGAIADGRVKLEGSKAKVKSSRGDSEYTVLFDLEKGYILSDDKGSRFRGYLGYPGLSVLFLKGKLPFDKKLSEALKGIPWKDLNDKFKDYRLTEEEVKKRLAGKIDPREIDRYIEKILAMFDSLGLHR